MSAKAARYDRRQSRNSQVQPLSLIEAEPVKDIIESARSYARKNPEAAALWCFGIGFVLGWKLKPW